MDAQFLFQTHPGDWPPQILLDVIGEGAQRRKIDTPHARFQSIRFKLSEERIENTQKAGQRFPASGWRGQQNRFAFENRRDAEQLRMSEVRKIGEKRSEERRVGKVRD